VLRRCAWIGVAVAVAACGEQEKPVATATATPVDELAERYVGLEYRDPPRGVKTTGGSLIGGVYAVSRMSTADTTCSGSSA